MSPRVVVAGRRVTFNPTPSPPSTYPSKANAVLSKMMQLSCPFVDCVVLCCIVSYCVVSCRVVLCCVAITLRYLLQHLLHVAFFVWFRGKIGTNVELHTLIHGHSTTVEGCIWAVSSQTRVFLSHVATHGQLTITRTYYVSLHEVVLFRLAISWPCGDCVCETQWSEVS